MSVLSHRLQNDHRRFVTLHMFLGVAPLTVSQACYVCAKLSGIRLLLTEGGQAGLLQRIRLNVSQDDVLFALRDSDTKKN